MNVVSNSHHERPSKVIADPDRTKIGQKAQKDKEEQRQGYNCAPPAGRAVNKYPDIRISNCTDKPVIERRRRISVHKNNLSTSTIKLRWPELQLPATLYVEDLWLFINGPLLHAGCVCQFSVQKEYE